MDYIATSAIRIGIIASLFKSLLIPSYRSTDFEVHRNWLAITHSLPVSQWYYENTSQWTLDYPPLFAWFEYSLSQAAAVVDPEMVVISKLEYASYRTIIFQRLSVVITDILLIYAVYDYCKWWSNNRRLSSSSTSHGENNTMIAAFVLMVLVIFNFGLIIIDHVHFQYNGMLFGIFLLSITKIAQEKFCQAALFFILLLNFKHLFAYVAPAYFVYLLRRYCFGKLQYSSWTEMRQDFRFTHLAKLSLIVLAVISISFGPFIAMINQLISRLFPFKRGLCHAYWAPNFWALYNVVDKAVAMISLRLGLLTGDKWQSASMTGGKVTESDHIVLPSIRPLTTFGLTLISILPSIVHLWRFPYSWRAFLRVMILCGFSSFIFGWHVHEKHLITVIVPFTLLAIENKNDARLFFLLSCIGHYSLFPLLYEPTESPIKHILYILYSIFAYYGLQLCSCSSLKSIHRLRPLKVSLFEKIYIIGLLFVQIYTIFLHSVFKLNDKLPFLPLLITSVYCSIGVLYVWANFYARSIWLTSDKNEYIED
ncbi:uncharacterized protein TRIADDRAFT_18456 [Trichoplax adhaerens]|uniref:Alpha-1,3-glucosyltransferase n=1 Tax=Trichoplax adhaerens TaxID=10228 RepID=B3RIR0_TRIAD|nr:hypothetical protein TRIADDRAFT_18456 [Trichoplax adhaerens]EDV29024.1 hypothetical protein TRIADDRAFT_18456 [Trichoplax adhaerens]|eukprot:XP_002108226.1 hypothetical protein TRIADDRAFT_18456 [Trichoplax adhaerens]